MQEHVQQLEERINRLQVENCELRQEIDVTVNKLNDREHEYHKMVDGTVSDYNSVNRKLQLFRQCEELPDAPQHPIRLTCWLTIKLVTGA